MPLLIGRRLKNSQSDDFLKTNANLTDCRKDNFQRNLQLVSQFEDIILRSIVLQDLILGGREPIAPGYYWLRLLRTGLCRLHENTVKRVGHLSREFRSTNVLQFRGAKETRMRIFFSLLMVVVI